MLARIIAREARAYLTSGLYAPGGRKSILERTSASPELGVFFVPGVAANISQFRDMKEALSGAAEWFDGFEYSALTHPAPIAESLAERIERAQRYAPRVLVIGHSLGGLLLRMVLQSSAVPKNIAGFVSICAPLHGTRLSRLALSPALRAIAPDSAIVSELMATRHRLSSLPVLTIGARYDSFIQPYDSAFLDGHASLVLEDVGHVASLFDARVHRAIRELATRLRA